MRKNFVASQKFNGVQNLSTKGGQLIYMLTATSSTTHFNVNEISDITLLSADKWEEVLATVPNVPIETSCAWWTRDAGKERYDVAVILQNGEILYSGGYSPGNGGIRPVFTVVSRTANVLKPGTKVTVGAFDGVIINTVTNPDLTFYEVLCDTVVRKYHFDNDTNEFGISDIRAYINSANFKKGIQYGVFDDSNGWM